MQTIKSYTSELNWMNRRPIAASFLVLFIIVLVLVATFNASNLLIHPTKNRITYYTLFSFHLTSNAIGDLILTCAAGLGLLFATRSPKPILVACSTFFILVSIFSYYSGQKSDVVTVVAGTSSLAVVLVQHVLGKRLFPSSRFQKVFLICWIAVESASLAFFVFFTAPTQSIQNVQLTSYEWVFSGISVVNPVLAVALVFSFLIRYFAVFKQWKAEPYNFTPILLITKRLSFIVGISAVISTLLFMYLPYSPIFNPDQQFVSTDEHDYLLRLERLDMLGSTQDIVEEIFVFNGERSLFISFLYMMKLILPSLSNLQILRLVPYLIWPAFVASVYYATLKLSNNRDIAVMSAVFSSLSSQPLVMLYGGFFANFAALSIAYLIFIPLSRIWKEKIRFHIIFYTICMIAVLLFVHVYTWTWFIGLLIAFTIVSLVKDKTNGTPFDLRKIVAIAIIIGLSITIDYIKVTTLGAVGGIERDIAIANENISYEQFVLRWNNLFYGFSTYLGGFISSIVFLTLAIYWTLRFKHDTIFERILLSTIYIMAFIFLFGDYVLQTRLFLNIPIGIIVSLVFYHKMAVPTNKVDRKSNAAVLLIIAVVIFSIHFLYRSFSDLTLPT